MKWNPTAPLSRATIDASFGTSKSWCAILSHIDKYRYYPSDITPSQAHTFYLLLLGDTFPRRRQRIAYRVLITLPTNHPYTILQQ